MSAELTAAAGKLHDQMQQVVSKIRTFGHHPGSVAITIDSELAYLVARLAIELEALQQAQTPADAPAMQPPAEPAVRPSADELAANLAAFKAWLSRNGDAPCTCGHAYRWHLADLSSCGDCNAYEPVHLRCTGFDLDRARVERAQ